MHEEMAGISLPLSKTPGQKTLALHYSKPIAAC